MKRIPKQGKTITICNLYFKQIPTFNSKIRTLTKRNKSKIQAMAMTFLESTEGKDKLESKIC
jgi:hypothetical protein